MEKNLILTIVYFSDSMIFGKYRVLIND